MITDDDIPREEEPVSPADEDWYRNNLPYDDAGDPDYEMILRHQDPPPNWEP